MLYARKRAREKIGLLQLESRNGLKFSDKTTQCVSVCLSIFQMIGAAQMKEKMPNQSLCQTEKSPVGNTYDAKSRMREKRGMIQSGDGPQKFSTGLAGLASPAT